MKTIKQTSSWKISLLSFVVDRLKLDLTVYIDHLCGIVVERPPRMQVVTGSLPAVSYQILFRNGSYGFLSFALRSVGLA